MDAAPILFVSAGLKEPKKTGNPFSKYHSYLNYGLLGLASILHYKGYNPRVYHGRFHDPKYFSKFVIENSGFFPAYPLFISLPSVFAMEWAKEFIDNFKAFYPGTKVIVGGRWVVGNDGKWIRYFLPNVDLVVYGTAENRIENLLNPKAWYSIENTDISLSQTSEPRVLEYPAYKYELMYDFEDFHPSIEVSRGCGLKCDFCLEKDEPLQKIKSPINILKEVNCIQNTFRNNAVTPYFESSFFRPSVRWANQLSNEYCKNNHSFKWRSETRIDSMPEDILNLLAVAGLKVLDIGLESASVNQLRLMNKSIKPEIYLQKASRFLKVCKSLGIWAKVNVLLYAGENEDTVSETIGWLNNHKDCIKGVSVSPLIVYGRCSETQSYLTKLKEYGAEPVDKDFFLKGYARMNLSKNMSYEASEEYRILISKLFMSHEDYFDLKSFSYLPPSFTRTQFEQVCLESDASKLPFDFRLQT
jgi:radical SAM superfamily enzyme YgiQ (UPF0313 family)